MCTLVPKGSSTRGLEANRVRRPPTSYANSKRLSFSRSVPHLHEVVRACCTNQLSALPPKTLDNLTAISGEMPRLPFTSSDKVVRVTPRAAAACVMLNPKGSMHWRNTKPPG